MRILYIIANFLMMLFVKRTIGARVIVVKDHQVLLVKHTYMPKWYTIGGGVELKEEAGIIIHGPLEILGSYYNVHQGHDDYVTVYVCKDFTEEDHIDSQEIAEKRWFSLDNLPEDMSPGSLRRIQEYLKLKPVSNQW